jgi:hypothetical protein
LLKPAEVVDEMNYLPRFEEWKDDYPKDARFWEFSLPIIPLGNGDYFGLYVRDNVIDPPVAFLGHEYCG